MYTCLCPSCAALVQPTLNRPNTQKVNPVSDLDHTLTIEFVSEHCEDYQQGKRHIMIVFDAHYLPYALRVQQSKRNDYSYGSFHWVGELNEGIAIFFYGFGAVEPPDSRVETLDQLLNELQEAYTVPGDKVHVINPQDVTEDVEAPAGDVRNVGS